MLPVRLTIPRPWRLLGRHHRARVVPSTATTSRAWRTFPRPAHPSHSSREPTSSGRHRRRPQRVCREPHWLHRASGRPSTRQRARRAAPEPMDSVTATLGFARDHGVERAASATVIPMPAQNTAAKIATITLPDQWDHMPLRRTGSASRIGHAHATTTTRRAHIAPADLFRPRSAGLRGAVPMHLDPTQPPRTTCTHDLRLQERETRTGVALDERDLRRPARIPAHLARRAE